MMPKYGVRGGDMEIEMGDDRIQQISLRRVNGFFVIQLYRDGLVMLSICSLSMPCKKATVLAIRAL
jgi:hypothetical protein